MRGPNFTSNELLCSSDESVAQPCSARPPAFHSSRLLADGFARAAMQRAPTSPHSPSPSEAAEVKWARVNETYQPNKDFGGLELAVNEGDLLELTGEQAPDGWLHAAKMVRGRRTVGLIPADYVDESSGDEDEDEDEDEATSGRESATGSSFNAPAGAPGAAAAGSEDGQVLMPPEEGVMQCIEDFTPDEGGLNEQAVTEGQLVELLDMEAPAGWLMGPHRAQEAIERGPCRDLALVWRVHACCSPRIVMGTLASRLSLLRVRVIPPLTWAHSPIAADGSCRPPALPPFH